MQINTNNSLFKYIICPHIVFINLIIYKNINQPSLMIIYRLHVALPSWFGFPNGHNILSWNVDLYGFFCNASVQSENLSIEEESFRDVQISHDTKDWLVQKWVQYGRRFLEAPLYNCRECAALITKRRTWELSARRSLSLRRAGSICPKLRVIVI